MAERPELTELTQKISQFNKQFFESKNADYSKLGDSVAEIRNLTKELAGVSSEFSGLKKALDGFFKDLDKATKQLTESSQSNIVEAVKSLDIKPQVTVDAPQVTVAPPKITVPAVDTKKLEQALERQFSRVADEIAALTESNTASNNDDVVKEVKKVEKAIRDLIAIPRAVGLSGGGGGAAGSSVITDIQDGAGDSVMDAANNAVRVNIIAGAGSGGTAMADDAAFTVASTSLTPVGGVVTSDTVDAGDTGAFAMLANRQQKVTLYDSSGVELSVGGGTQYDEDTAHVSGDKVTLAGVVRNDTRGALSGTNGDRTVLQVNSSGDLRVDGSAVTQPVSAASLPLPTGAATSANQTTIIGHVDGIEGLLTTIDADTGNLPTIETNTDFGTVTGGGVETGALRVTIANNSTGVLSVDDNGSTLSVDDGGSSLTVDAPVGTPVNVQIGDGTNTATVRNLASNDALNVAITDASGNHITSFGGGTQYQEDAAHTTGDTGTMSLAVRKDTATALAGTDGDYTPLISDASGRLHVQPPSITQGAGAVGATTPRMTLASDDPAVVALQLIDNAISGSEMQVDVVASLPAGTNNIGDVDVLSVVPGTGATNLGKAVDSAAGATDTGVAPLAVRDDSLTTLTEAEGDYVPLRVSATGALHVTGGGGGTEYTEDAAAAADPTGNASILVRSDTPATITSTDGDNVAQRGTNYGAAYVQLVTSSGSYIDSVGGGTQYNEDAAHSTGATGTLSLAVRDDNPVASSGTTLDYEVLHTDRNGALWVRDVNDQIVLFDDNFSDDVNVAWNLTSSNGAALALTNAAYQFMTGGQALKFSSGTSSASEVHRYMYWPPGANYVSWEIIFASMGENMSNFGFYLSYRNASDWIRGRVLHVNSTNVWSYMDSAGVNQTLLTRDTSESATFARWHRVYMEIDITNGQYRSVQIDDQDYTSTVSGLSLRSSADTAVPHMLDFAIETTNTGSSSDLIFDRMVAKAWR